MVRFKILLPALVLLIALSINRNALGKPDFSVSSFESRKHGIFVHAVDAKPDHFHWEGHEAMILDSWLERLDGNTYLCFKLAIDGSRFDEAKINEKKDQWPVFQQEGFKSDPGYQPIKFTTKRGVDYLLGGTHGETVHLMRMKQPLPKQLSLRVGTYTIAGTSMAAKEVFGDTVITFNLLPENE